LRPLSSSLEAFGGGIHDDVLVWVKAGTLSRDKTDLENKLASAQSELAYLKDVQTENNDLRRELALPIHQEFLMVSAEVVSHSSPGTAELTIDKGSSDGLSVGQAVVKEGILTGQLSTVHSNSATVRLLNDSRSTTPATLVGTSTSGIARLGKSGLLELSMIPNSEKVQPGSQVVTSGVGETLPSGILIGNVKAAKQDPSNVFWQISLKLPIDYGNLERVFVITGTK
jgi:rod shape-determining protein MreC